MIHCWRAYIFLVFIFSLKCNSKHVAFHITLFLGYQNFIECTVEFKNKGNNSVNETQIQLNLKDYVDYLLKVDRME